MDAVDLRILQALQSSARVKNSKLARELGMAPSTVLERIRRLEKRRLVRGYRAIIEPKNVGLTVQAFIVITLDRHDVNVIRTFETGVKDIPNVRACYHLSGRFDYLLHVAVEDLNRLGRLVKADMASIPGIGRSETLLVFSEIKPDEGWPIGDLVRDRTGGKTPVGPGEIGADHASEENDS